MNAERQPAPNSVAQKQLFILQKLHEEWELKGQESRLDFDWTRYERWCREGCIEDNGQLMNILIGLKKLGLIDKAEWINPAM